MHQNDSPQCNIAFRLDASTKIGVGHAMRCLAIAEQWQQKNYLVHFIMRECNRMVQNRLTRQAIKYHVVPAQADLENTVEIILKTNSIACFLDGYHFSTDYQAGLRKKSPMLIYIDDNQMPEPETDIVVNYSPLAEQSFYKVAKDTRLLLGMGYLPLRSEFTTSVEKHDAKPNIIVTMGGTDPAKLSLPIVSALLDSIPNHWQVEVLITDSHPQQLALQKLQQENRQLTVHINATDIAKLFMDASMAISAAGSTLWELAACQTPTVAISVAENQQVIHTTVYKQWFIPIQGGNEKTTIEQTTNATIRLIRDQKLRQQIILALGDLNLGQGAKRLVDEIENHLNLGTAC